MTVIRHSAKHAQQGFTLLEVLIAVLVLAFGLMGLAGIQATGIKNNNSAHYRSVAAQYAAEMADRIRANPTFDYTSVTTPSPHVSCKTTTGCTPQEMAENDLYEWKIVGLPLVLPLGTGAVGSVSTSPVNIFKVTVSWDDTRSGTASTSFELEVRP